MTDSNNPFVGVTIVSIIVFTAAFTLLIMLVYKGWKKNNMRDYLLIYLCLLNMAAVWASQVPLGRIESMKNYNYLECIFNLREL
jgi:hypothetical protein